MLDARQLVSSSARQLTIYKAGFTKAFYASDGYTFVIQRIEVLCNNNEGGATVFETLL